MDYEKAYNALVESIKTLKEAHPSDECIQAWVKYNVPELAKSKDERIIDEILDFIEFVADSQSNKDEWIDWLLRQSEEKTAWSADDLRDEILRYLGPISENDVKASPISHLYRCAEYFYELGLKTKKGE